MNIYRAPPEIEATSRQWAFPGPPRYVRWVRDGQVDLECIRMSEAKQSRLRWLAGPVDQRIPQANWSEPVTCLSAAHM